MTSTADAGFARAQADYEAQMPPEPVEHDYTADVAVTFYLTLDGLTFDTGAQDEQMKDWMRDQFMPRLHAIIRQEIEQTDPGVGLLNFLFPSGRPTDPVVDSEYEITEVRA